MQKRIARGGSVLKLLLSFVLVIGLMPSLAYAGDGKVASADSDVSLAASDTTAPTLKSVSVSPKYASAGDTVTVTAEVDDGADGSGVDNVYVYYDGTKNSFDSVDLRKQGDGTWSGTRTVGEYDTAGKWSVRRVYLADVADNSRSVYASDLDMSDASFTVTDSSSSLDKNVVWAPSGQTLACNGKEQTGVAGGDGYTVTGGSATDPGSYTAKLSLVDKANTVWNTTGTSDDIEVSWSISEPDYTWCVDDGNQKLSVSLGTASTVSWSLSDYSVASIVSSSSSIVSWGSYQNQVAGVTISPDKEGYTELTASVNGSVVSRATIRVTPSKRIDISAADVSGLESSYVYTGSAIAPALTVTVDGKALTQDSDYTVSFSNNVNAGTATAYVSGINNYRGSITKTFQITKADPSCTAPTGIVAVVGQTLADVALPEGFSWQDDAATSVGAAGTHTFKAIYTPSDAANYNVVRDIEVAVTVSAAPVDISSAAVEVVGGPFTYSGKAVEPDVNVTINGKKLVKDTDYKVTFSNNVNAGTATVTVEGIGAYGGTAKKAFQIAKADPSYTVPTGIWADSSQTLADVKLPSGFAWQDAATTSVGAAGTHTFKAVYTPSDAANYNVVRDIEVAVTVTEEVRFSDVAYDDPGCWYADGVTFCSSRGLIMGYGSGEKAGQFGVGDPLTRAQLAAILWRCAEPDAANAYEGAASNETGMSDVGADEWYTAAANWAVANGVVNGFDDPDGRHFRPHDCVTMEQLATILANYIDMAGAEAADQSVLSAFTDQDAISGWARGSVAWAKQNSLVSGYDNHDGTRTLNPQESVARERVAVVLMNAYNSGVLK